jgi:hypothetical protein
MARFKKTLSQSVNQSANNAFLRTYGISRVVENLHIHGKIGNYPVIGVDNEEQILNPKLRQNNGTDIPSVFIKQDYLKVIQNRNVNQPIDAIKALQVIETSDIICSFGASIGETDTYWWKIIGKWLKGNNKLFVIFDICGKNDDGVSPISILNRETEVNKKRQQIFERFTRLANWKKADISAHKEKIVVELDCDMFNFKLPKKIREET